MGHLQEPNWHNCQKLGHKAKSLLRFFHVLRVVLIYEIDFLVTETISCYFQTISRYSQVCSFDSFVWILWYYVRY